MVGFCEHGNEPYESEDLSLRGIDAVLDCLTVKTKSLSPTDIISSQQTLSYQLN